MIQRAREYFRIPEFEDEDKNLAARLLSIILATIVGLTLFLTFPLALMLPRGNLATALQGVIALIFSAVLYYLLRIRKVAAASWLLTSLFWTLNLLSVWTGGGIRSSAYSNFMLIILTAGLLLGARAGVVFTVLSAVFGFLFVLAENNGLLTNPAVEQTTFTRWFGSVAIFIMIALLQGLASNNMRRALKKARDAEVRYRTLVEQIPAITYMDRATLHGVTEYVSPQVVSMLGVQPAEWMQGEIDFWLGLIHPEDQPAAREAYAASVNSGVPFNLEYRMVARDGRLLWVHDKAFVLPDARGKPEWIHGVIFDITDRKQAELESKKLIADLEAKNTEMERFVYTVSHDLKSPIITIKGFLGFLSEDASTGNLKRLEADLLRISEAADKMHTLLNDLLELSRIGRLMNDPEPVDCNKLFFEVEKILQGRFQERSTRVHVNGRLPIVQGDRQRLFEVFQNLLDNASKFMGDQPNPLIEIGARGEPQNGLVTLYVRDNGIGIAPQYHERIFGLFNRLDPKVEGTGVGLALVRRIVEIHGGKIWVESETEQGATFFFTLPHAK